MMMKGGCQRRHAGALFTCGILCFITATHAWMTPRMNSNRLSIIQLSKDDSEESSTTLDFVSIEDAGSSSNFGDFIPLHKAEDEMDIYLHSTCIYVE